MTPIFSYTDLINKRRLRAQAVISNLEKQYSSFTDGDIITMMRRRLIEEIVNRIVNDKELVRIVQVKDTITLRTSLFVLTEEEMLELCQSKFREGVNHASGFRAKEPWTFLDP